MDVKVWSWGLVFLGLGIVFLELILGVATGFDLALLGSCLIIGGIAGLITANIYLALGTTSLLAFLYIFVGRKFLKSKLFITFSKTNIDTLVGQKGVVVKEITRDNAGQVKIGAETWRAIPMEGLDKISENDKIEVIDVEGVSLVVKK